MDGYGSPGDPSCGNGPETDCNDSDPNINPGAVELCNGIDDNCDPSFQVDEGFTIKGLDQAFAFLNPGLGQTIDLVPGDTCVVGEGICEQFGIVECSVDGLSVLCNTGVPPIPPEPEGPAADASCFDSLDNDCDGETDHADPDCTDTELCDGFDNDNDESIDEDFPDLDTSCTVGFGICVKSGIMVCTADGAGVECNVGPHAGMAESPPGSKRCIDGLDNDCDGLTDLGDPDCQEPEKCDGKDNDGDTLVDEDFPDKGDLCSVGVGLCQSFGLRVCNPRGTDTVCGAAPGRGAPEGPVSCDCADGIDNDCDGLIDIDDPDCGSVRLRALAALPFCGPQTDNDCKTWHTVDFEALGGGLDTQVTAELLALNVNGEILPLAPVEVEVGDSVRFESDLFNPPSASSQVVPLDLDLFAGWSACVTGPENGPIPAGCEAFDLDCDDDIDLHDFILLELQFGGTRRFHLLSAPVPMLRVTAQDGLNKAEGFASSVPFLNVIAPDQTVVVLSQLDRTHVTAAIPLVDPASLFIKVDGVDILTQLALNPAVDFPGGPFGGLVNINGQDVKVCDLVVRSAPIDELSSNTVEMYLENLGCGGHVIVIDGDKRPGSFPDVPDLDCHVDDIRDAGISHGFEVTIATPTDGSIDPAPPTTVLGDVCHGRLLPVNKTGDSFVKLNGLLSLLGDEVLTLGDGENSADTFHYPISAFLPETAPADLISAAPGIPGTLDPGPNRLVAEAEDDEFNTAFDNVFFAVGPVIPSAASGNARSAGVTMVDKAFNLALDVNGVNTAFQTACNKAAAAMVSNIEDRFDNIGLRLQENQVCDANIRMDTFDVLVPPGGFDCTATPVANEIQVVLNVPDIAISMSAGGHCKIVGPVFGVCWASLTLGGSLDLIISGARVAFTIDEAGILTGTTSDLGFNVGVVDEGDVSITADVGCILGLIFDTLNFLTNPAKQLLQEVIAPGGTFHLEFGGLNFGALLGTLDGNPLDLDLISFDNQDLPDFAVELSSALTDVQIDPGGMAVAIEGTFTPIEELIDPEVANLPGTPLTDAPLPLPPLPNADDLAYSISDDVFNQLFAGLASTGRFKTLFEDTRDLQDFLPDCDTLPTPEERGRCWGARAANCNARPDDERVACLQGRIGMLKLNLSPTTKTILHGRTDVPPVLHINDSVATPDKLEVVLRLKSVSVSLVADRDGGGYNGDFNVLPPCLDDPPGTGECILWEACMDVNVQGFFVLTTSVNGKPELQFMISPMGHTLSTGTMCGGGTADFGDGLIDESFTGMTIDSLASDLGEDIPPLELQGMDLGGLVKIVNPRLMAIDGDYIVITGTAAPPDP